MTITDLKQQLPEVKVNLNGKLYNGKISGRTLRFPIVRFENYAAEYSWETILNAVTSGKPLIA
jgi:hypothetical protein